MKIIVAKGSITDFGGSRDEPDESKSMKGFAVCVRVVLVGVALCLVALIAATPNRADAFVTGGNGFVAFSVDCKQVQRANVDPIAYYGVERTPHAHTIGGEPLTPTTDRADLLRHNDSTCVPKKALADADVNVETALWIPTMYNKDTRRVIPLEKDEFTIYYSIRSGVETENVRPWPDNLGLVIGDPNATGPIYITENQTVIQWRCQEDHGRLLELGAHPPEVCPKGSNLAAYFRAPDCMKEGYNAEAHNDSQYMRYSSHGQCPDGYYNIPQIILNVEWEPRRSTNKVFSSGNLYTAHGDYLSGWASGDLQEAIDLCVDETPCGR